jgi:hypothetical protein
VGYQKRTPSSCTTTTTTTTTMNPTKAPSLTSLREQHYSQNTIMRILETNQQTKPISPDCKYSLSSNPRKYFVAYLLISTASTNNKLNNNIVEPFALPWLQFYYDRSSLVFALDLGTFSFFYFNVAVLFFLVFFCLGWL